MLTLRSERSKEIATAVAVPLIAVLAFGLGEAALQLVSLSKYGTTQDVAKTDLFQKDRNSGLNLPVPGAGAGALKFNSNGFRGPEIDVLPRSSTLRLAFLGSSTTLDGGNNEVETWPAIASKLVAAKMPEGCHVEYLNAGLPAFGTPQMQAYFEAVVHKFAPTVTIILPGDVTNDIDFDLRKLGYRKQDVISPSWLARRSLLWEKIEKNLKVVSLQRKARRSDGFVDFDEERFADIFRGRLTALVQAIRKGGSEPALVTITGRLRHDQSEDERINAALTALFYNPFTSVDDLIAGREAYNQRIRFVAREYNVSLVDDPYVIPPTKQYFSDSLHFTSLGSAAQARRVAASLLGAAQFRRAVRGVGGACSALLP